MQFCDTTESVISWSSEEVIVPYLSPLDGKMHRYFVDFWIRIKTSDGSEQCLLIEIKPKAQTKKPIVEGKTMTRSKIQRVKDWIINSAKWEAAEAFCNSRGWKFKILTEKEIFGKKEVIL
jgi:TnsA endonuclease N terminal